MSCFLSAVNILNQNTSQSVTSLNLIYLLAYFVKFWLNKKWIFLSYVYPYHLTYPLRNEIFIEIICLAFGAFGFGTVEESVKKMS